MGVVTEKVPARYRSIKMADASPGKCSFFCLLMRHRVNEASTECAQGQKKCVEMLENTGRVAGNPGKAVRSVCRSVLKNSGSHQIPNQNKTKSKLQILKNCQKFKFLNTAKYLTHDTPSEIA